MYCEIPNLKGSRYFRRTLSFFHEVSTWNNPKFSRENLSLYLVRFAGSEKQNVSLRKTLVSKFAERPL